MQPCVTQREERSDIYQSNSFDRQKSKNYFYFPAVTLKLIGFWNHFNENFHSTTLFQYFWIFHIIKICYVFLYKIFSYSRKSIMKLLRLHSIKSTFSLRSSGNHKVVKQRHDTETGWLRFHLEISLVETFHWTAR